MRNNPWLKEVFPSVLFRWSGMAPSSHSRRIDKLEVCRHGTRRGGLSFDPQVFDVRTSATLRNVLPRQSDAALRQQAHLRSLAALHIGQIGCIDEAIPFEVGRQGEARHSLGRRPQTISGDRHIGQPDAAAGVGIRQQHAHHVRQRDLRCGPIDVGARRSRTRGPRPRPVAWTGYRSPPTRMSPGRTIPAGDFYQSLGLPERSAGYPRLPSPTLGSTL